MTPRPFDPTKETPEEWWADVRKATAAWEEMNRTGSMLPIRNYSRPDWTATMPNTPWDRGKYSSSVRHNLSPLSLEGYDNGGIVEGERGMPNVAGREFAYTPQGMAAAEQYKQSLGMRGGGMMGFRPVGYMGGGDVVESETEIVLDPQSRAAYIERIMAARGMNDESIFMNLSDADIYNAYLAVEAAPSQGMGAPFIGDAPRLGQGVTENPGFEEETFDYFPPERRARGGYVGRGTSAGELAPRGSMSVREAGETMYELAKRRRGMRGGGIMSLRR